jgi:hypothetical protein
VREKAGGRNQARVCSRCNSARLASAGWGQRERETERLFGGFGICASGAGLGQTVGFPRAARFGGRLAARCVQRVAGSGLSAAAHLSPLSVGDYFVPAQPPFSKQGPRSVHPVRVVEWQTLRRSESERGVKSNRQPRWVEAGAILAAPSQLQHEIYDPKAL